MDNELNKTPEINPLEQAPNQTPDTKPEQHYHFKEVVPPEVVDDAPPEQEVITIEKPDAAVIEQAPVVEEDLIPEEVRMQKIEEDLKADKSELDFHDAAENLMHIVNRENPDIPHQ